MTTTLQLLSPRHRHCICSGRWIAAFFLSPRQTTAWDSELYVKKLRNLLASLRQQLKMPRRSKTSPTRLASVQGDWQVLLLALSFYRQADSTKAGLAPTRGETQGRAPCGKEVSG